MGIALGIAIGISTIETMLLLGIGMVIFIAPDRWKEHKRETTDRLHKAWQVHWKNGEGDEISSDEE